MKKIATTWLYVLAATAMLPTAAFASATAGVPEISPGSISAGLALLAGGVIMLRARRAK
jgi:hypothetical protein